MSQRIRMLLQRGVLAAACMAVFAAALLLFGCTDRHEHELFHTDAVAATCTESGSVEYWKCLGCGKLFADAEGTKEIEDAAVEALGHDWGEGEAEPVQFCTDDYTLTYTCQRAGCGETKTETVTGNAAHALDGGTVIKAASCVAEGERLFRCTNADCAYTKTEVIPATGHILDAGTVVKAATCSEAGSRLYSCAAAGCNYTFTEIIPATGAHVLDEGEQTKAPTCLSAGEKLYRCTNEGCTYTELVPVTPLGHAWGEGVAAQKSLCTEPQTITYTCQRVGCGEVKQESIAAEHTAHALEQGEVVKENSCTESGSAVYRCTNEGCSYSVTQPLSPLGHSWDSQAACAERVCTACGAELPASEAHTYTEELRAATCSQDGARIFTCAACGDSYTEAIPAFGHAMEWLESTAVKGCETTVTVTGKCTRAGCTHSESMQPQVTETHKFTESIARPATCQSEGVRLFKCTECSTTKEEPYTDKEAHAWVQGAQAGGTVMSTCSLCSAAKTSIVAESEAVVTKADLKEADEVALGDTYIQLDDKAVEALEGEEFTLAVEEVPVKEVEGAIEGERVYSITMNTMNGGDVTQFGGTITVRLPYTLQEGDDVGAIHIAYIDENGNAEAIRGTYSNGYVTFETDHFSYYTVRQYTAEQLCEQFGHNVQATQQQASCLQDGYLIETCTRCGKIVTNKVVTALGHDYRVKEQTAPTCIAAGSTAYACSRCSEEYTQQFPATGHSWEMSGTAAATCTAAGSINYTCKTCGAVRSEATEALGHDIEQTVTAYPTCTGRGEYTYACTRCDYSYTEEIPAVGHILNASVTPATCGENGYTTYLCSVCGYSYEDDVVPATGEHTIVNGICTVCGQGCEHEFGEGAVTPPQCTQQGYTTYTCTVCGYSYTADIADALGHSYTIDPLHCDLCGLCRYEHDDEVTAQLVGERCGEGVVITRTCKSCGRVQTQTLYEHATLQEEVVLDMPVEHAGDAGARLTFVWRSCLCGASWGIDYGAGDCQVEIGYWNGEYYPFYCTAEGCNINGKEYTDFVYDGDDVCTGVYTIRWLVYDGEELLGEASTAFAAVIHDIRNIDAELAEGAETCEDGVIITRACDRCGEEFEPYESYWHVTIEEEMVNVAVPHTGQEGARCILTYYTCPCGESYGINMSGCVLSSLEYDEEKGCYIAYCTEPGCDFWLKEYKTPEPTESPCETWYDEYFVFYRGEEQVGEFAMRYLQKDHKNTVTEAELAPGATSCEEGVVVTQYCTECGTIIYQQTEYNHYMMTEELLELPVDHGGEEAYFRVFRQVCVCGQEQYIDYLGSHCQLYESVWDEEKGCFVSNCAVEGCDISFEWTESFEYDGDGMCSGRWVQNYTFKKGGEVLGEYSGCYRDEQHMVDRKYTLAEGASSCGEGLVCTEYCTRCGQVLHEFMQYGHFTSGEEYLNIASGHGDEGRWIVYVYRCPCGEEAWIAAGGDCSFSLGEWDEERKCTVYRCEAEGCSNWYERYSSTFEYAEEGSCIGQNVTRYVFYRGQEVVGEYTLTEKEERHDVCETIAVELAEGSVTCEDGVFVTDCCLRCGKEFEPRLNYGHVSLAEELLNVPADHGNPAIDARFIVEIDRCACGKSSWVDVNAGDCYFVQDKVEGETAHFIYRCAVTGCENWYEVYRSFIYADESSGCLGEETERYIFYSGDSVLEEVTIVHGDRYQHTMVHESSESTWSEDLAVGETWTQTDIYRCQNENCPYSETNIFEYMRTEEGEPLVGATHKQIREDGSVQEETWRYDPENYGRTASYRFSLTDAKGSVLDDYTDTYAYGEGCEVTVTRECRDTANYEAHTEVYTTTVHAEGGYCEATCTQYGGPRCLLCGEWYGKVELPRGHAYDAEGYCLHCNLYNPQMADGFVAAEDLSSQPAYTEGREGSVILGVRSLDAAYTYDKIAVTMRAVQTQTGEGQAIDAIGALTPGLNENISECGLYVAEAKALLQALDAYAAQAGVDASACGVEFNFVPTWADENETNYVCSITLTYAEAQAALS